MYESDHLYRTIDRLKDVRDRHCGFLVFVVYASVVKNLWVVDRRKWKTVQIR